ncbi:MAG: nucleotidyltransferase domain-containing protein [Lachnoclostridium sp.]|jgi:predicted nucleotidyltransferase|nr:nucleotidyltransferase domain-containing protein [Lachnoclostridium sp.]
MVMTDEIIKIKEKIIDTIRTEKIYLFGSYAYGTPTDESDYDFYVVIPNDSMRPLEAVQNIYCSMPGVSKKPVDVLAGTVDIFERRSKEVTLEHIIARDGLILYDRTQ